MKTHRIHCFGRTDESGNAAIVVEGSTLTQSQRQAFAREQADLAGIAEWSRKHGISGIYVYSRLRDGVYAGRNFNHLEPRLEDAATGVAARALALVVRQSVTLLQGDGLGQPCTLVARYIDGAVQVGGRAVRVAAAHSFNG